MEAFKQPYYTTIEFKPEAVLDILSKTTLMIHAIVKAKTSNLETPPGLQETYPHWNFSRPNFSKFRAV
jgi:hypothetical protein